jgi:phosphoglycolate phosphatase
MQSSKTVSFLIVDLDNTLYDWFHFWFNSFTAMLQSLVAQSGLSEQALLPEIKAIHQRHGTAEYSLLIEEIPSLKKRHPNEDLKAVYGEAIEQYRNVREQTLALYPGVRETLQTLKESGCVLAAYTESMAFYTNDRIRRLKLDGLIDVLYSPPDHKLPKNLTMEQLRRFPSEHYQLKSTIQRTVPKGERKPNPKILLDIIRHLGATPDNSLYIGDSLMKDVLMAQQAGVTDVWAKYGATPDKKGYDLLRAVTYWTDEEVERERSLKLQDVKPTHSINAFPAILKLFRFAPLKETIS